MMNKDSPENYLPRVCRVSQRFARPRAGDLALAVKSELDGVLPSGAIPPGAEIGITVGSRGITGIATIARAAVEYLQRRGARPFIIPAMGSHGGAVAEGQRQLLAQYGVTEAAMGAPIRDAMETRSLGRTPEGVEVFLAEIAWEADGIVLLNRVKPHTDFKGPIESGLAKICTIGLGKYDGACEYHSHMFGIGLGAAIRSGAEKILSTGRILAGLGILENAYHETARIAGVRAAALLAGEERLLEEARKLTARLPLLDLDVLVCDRIGKEISGTGLDTNIIGRGVHGYLEGTPWHEGMPAIYRIVVLDLTDESRGNAVGMGMVDFVPERFSRKVDFRVTGLNSVAAHAPANARLPIVTRNDAEALANALKTCLRRPGGPLLAHVRDTLHLSEIYLSEACLPLIEGREDLEVLSGPTPMEFDADGNMLSPFDR